MPTATQTAWLTTAEAAAHAKRAQREIQRAIQHGQLRAYRPQPGANYRIDAEDLDRFIRGEAA